MATISRWVWSSRGYTPPADTDLLIDYNVVAPDYSQTMNVPLVRGRDFNSRDAAGTPDVVIINERMARRFWPNADALGKRLSIEGVKGSLTFVSN